MSELQELMHDIEEGRKLLSLASRKRWSDVVTVELAKLEEKVKVLNVKQNTTTTTCIDNSIAKKPNITNTINTIIRNYSWDQSDKYLKIYIALNGIQNLPKDNVKCEFDAKKFNFVVRDLEGKNYELTIYLAYQILPEKSIIKIKTDTVVILAAKAKTITWEAVTAEEKRVLDGKKEKPSPKSGPDSSDPSAGIMGIMKQMYDEGDDEMKRMLNKTWYETQAKKNSDLPGMPDLDL